MVCLFLGNYVYVYIYIYIYIYAFPPFSMIWPTISKVTVESEKSVNNGSNMADSDQIYLCIWNSDSTASYCTRLAFIALRHKETSPSAPETKSTGLTLPRGEEYQLDFQKKTSKNGRTLVIKGLQRLCRHVK